MAVFERPTIAVTQNAKRLLSWLIPANTKRRSMVESALKYLSPLYAAAHTVKVLFFGPISPRQHVTLNRTPSVVPSHPQPDVTILIPVHGKWPITKRCLASIALHHENRHAVEVLLVDDASPDQTVARAQEIAGLRIHQLEGNVGFTKAVNEGLGEARGRHVVVLNNDTVVMPGWLNPLLEWGNRPGVGLVGVTLLFPDGRIQEAGGALFSDATAANLLRGERRRKVKGAGAADVDYCSGAALLISRQLLDRVGGFDERYSPAYYEDTDLAMTARAMGLRVIHEPRSQVIHYEGATHGRALDSGWKTYQVRNRVFFFDKWREELANFPNPLSERAPRVRSLPAGKLVVIFDELIPTPDRDSGSARMMQILGLLVALGYQPIFVPRNRLSFRRYIPNLEALGVTVWVERFEPWKPLDNRINSIFCFIVSRPTVGERYLIPLIHRYPDVPIVYDTVDLHFVRWERQMQISPNAHTINSVESMKRLELTLARLARATLVTSPVEQDLLVNSFNLENVFVAQNAHELNPGPTVENRSGLIFVGNFQHPPNVDAMVWFLDDVLPLVLQELPETTLTIVGDRAPRFLTARSSPQVNFAGWVPDTSNLYHESRVAIAPLRFGAGMKGKVGDAMARGVPTVLTSIAAEGIGVTSGKQVLIGDSPEEFSQAIIRLCREDELWNSICHEALETVRKTLGRDQLRTQVDAALKSLSSHPSG